MTHRRLILAGALIDGLGGPARRKVFIAVEDGIIADIAPLSQRPKAFSGEVDDLSHCVLSPALVDCGLFLGLSPALTPPKSAEDSESMIERHRGYCLAHGVLGVGECRQGGDPLAPPQPVTTGNLPPAVRFIDTPSYDNHPGRGFLRVEYTPDIADTCASTDPDIQTLRQVKEGSYHKLIIRANGAREVRDALEAGCDAIEQGYNMGEDNLRTMARQKVLWIPSVLRAKNALDGSASGGSVCCRFSLRYVAPGKAIPGAESFWKKTLNEQLRQLTRARELGIKTAVGTGAGNLGILHGESVVEEIKLFMKAGYSREEAISCASVNGAQFLEFKGLGPLKVGSPATFLITRGSIQQLPRKLSYLEGIYIEGTPCPSYRK